MTNNDKTIIGTNAYVHVDGVSQPVLAKVDTGADGTSLWASGVRIGENDRLFFRYFGPSSVLYDGKEHFRDDYRVVKVTSSTGDSQIRFQIKQKIKIGDKTVVVWCSLTDRSKRSYPMLIGARTLKGRFLVDVARADKKHAKAKGRRYHEIFLENKEAILGKYRAEKSEEIR